MAQIFIRNLKQETLDRLKRKAKTEGKSLEEKIKAILEQAVQMDPESARKLADQLTAMFKGRKLKNSVVLIREGRSH
jgi:plasmid stability protein